MENRPTFGINTLPVEIVSGQSSSSGNEGKEFSQSKWWFIGGLVVVIGIGYYIFKK